MSVVSGDCSSQLTSREQRRLEREERKRRRNAQEPAKQSTSARSEKKTPNKDEKRKKKTDFSSTNGSATKKPPSGARKTQPTYDNVKIIEKTSPQDVPEKENKGKAANDGEKTSSSRRHLGSKFLDNLSKFENQAKQRETVKERSPFVRSYSSQQNDKQESGAAFRRSYRPSRSTPVVDDPSVLVRRSLRKERVLDSIAKLEKSASSKGSLRKTPGSPGNERSLKSIVGEKKTSSRPSSASSSKTSISDSGSSTSSAKGQKSRAQQALERHKERMRSSSQTGPGVSPGKRVSPSSKTSPTASAESKTKTPKSSKRTTKREKSLAQTPSFDESSPRKISVTKSPLPGDDTLEVTTETEVMTPSNEKLKLVVKERANSMEDIADLMSPNEPTDESEYQPGDPRPMSVEDAVAMFSSEEVKTPTPEPVDPATEKTKVRRKLPEIPTEAQESVERRRRKYASRKRSEDGSGEPQPEKNMVVIETSPSFDTPTEHSTDQKSQNDQNTQILDQKSPKQGIVPKLAPMFSFKEEEPKVAKPGPAAAKSGSVVAKSGPVVAKDDPKVAKDEPKVAKDEPVVAKHKTKKHKTRREHKSEQKHEPVHAEQVKGHQEPIRDEESPAWVVATAGSPKERYSPEAAIQELRRLSEEIHTRSSGTGGQSSVTKSIDDVIVEERISPDLVSDVKKKKKRRHKSKEDKAAEPRPSSLHIEEVLYSTDTVERPRSSSGSLSPKKKSEKHSPIETFFISEEEFAPVFTQSSSEQKRKSSSSREARSSTSSAKTPSKPSSPTKKAQSPSKTPVSPLKSPVSPAKTPISPLKDPSAPTTPLSPAKGSPSPVRSLSPLKSPTSPTKSLEIRTPSPEKVILEVKSSKIKTDVQQIDDKKPSIKEEKVSSVADTNTMMGKRPFVTRRYKKSWLDDSSDDDDVSLLSDAASDDLEIDLEWLGTDSDDDDYTPVFRGTSAKSSGGGVQRTTSKAADMLALWERKAAEPLNRSPSAKPIATEIRIGSVKAAWEVKANNADGNDKGNKKERNLSNGGVANGHSSPEKMRQSPGPSPRKFERTSSIDFEPKANEEEKKEMMDIFDEKVSGKIQGAKALFENIAQSSSSPVRSPSFKRSPIKLRPDSSSSSASGELSPVVSRKSSVAESASQASEETSEQSPDVIEEVQKVDSMRAMFENQAKQKQETRRQKPSLADMVSDGNDNCDITDVRSVKAMWQSMDNHRLNKSAEKAKPKSNIQKRIAAKKKTRRSMTQPITTDDVKKAQDMMSSNTSSDVEEETINFADRLKFFNKLISAPTKPQKKEPVIVGRRRTQPIHPVDVDQATELQKEKSGSQNLIDESREEKSPEPEPLAKVDITARVDLSPVEKVDIRPPKKLDLSPLEREKEEKSDRPEIDQSPISSVRRVVHQFSISSSSDNESLLSSSSTSFDDSEPGRKKLFLSSSEDDMSVHVAEIKSTGSIHERLKRLQQKNSEEKWKKKPLSEIKGSLGDRMNKLKNNDEKWKKNQNSDLSSRVEKLSERIARIKEDSKTWKSKTGQQNDAAQFTVQAKMAKREGQKIISVLPSPSIKRRVLPAVVPDHVVTEKEAETTIHHSSSMNQLSFVEKLATKGLEENVLKKTEVQTTEVPTIDIEEFEKFFGVVEENLTNGDVGLKIEIEDLPDLEHSTKLSDLGRLKTSVRQQSKRKSGARNPVKALAARTDIKQSYDTHRSNITTLEQQRISAQRGHGANFTSAALAGLAAKADLSKVNLRSTKNTPMPSSDDLRPFKDVMLLRAKGRRQVQTRLVEPCAKSLSSDDAFLLVTGKKLFGWFGEFCNVIERAKVNEIADYIIRKGDLGCKVSSLISIEELSTQSRHKEFWELLGGLGEWDKTTSQGTDEQFEVDAAATIKTYKMVDSKLIPHEDAWGKLPTMGMLGSNDTFVFDFGAEMYIWQGKDVSFADRRLAVRLARVIWDQGYDYTEFGVCPFHCDQLKGKRPEFGLFARVNENLETSLFQEKFEDWSNIHREVGVEEAQLRETSRGKAIDESKVKSSIVTDEGPYDVTKMRDEVVGTLPLVIEGHDISRGDGDITDEDGRILEIVTTSVEAFHITESSADKFDDCVLHRSNSYVVKWKYSISSTGRFINSKEKEATKSDSSNGRHRVAYFAWAGVDSAVNDKGASALIAANMDTDDGPIINVEEATAPPVFNKCFDGKLMITNGKRGERRGAYNWRLFMVRGESVESAALVEVPCECKSLRSCSSFVAMMPRDTAAVVWHGCRSPKKIREAAEQGIKKLSDRMPGSLPFRRNPTSLKISVCEEGDEIDLFWEAVGIKRRNRYQCLLDVDVKQKTTRAWKFTSQSESFVALELCPLECDTQFPLVQEQFLEIETPSIVLLDCTHGAFLWQNCGTEKLTGSAKRRWDVIRRLAMETTLKYCEENDMDEAKLIEAGFEPVSFTNAFPSWKTKEKSKFDKSLTQKPRAIREVLSTLSRVTYTIEELRAPDLPDGVDARHLETYLSTSDFEKLFEMSRNEFYELPAWKQTKMRKQKKLF